MDAKDMAALAISLIAPVVALYGVWERSRDRQWQERRHLDSIVENLSEVEFDAGVREAELRRAGGQLPFGVAATFNARRRSLGEQGMLAAQNLKRRSGRRGSSDWARPHQYLVIADALSNCGQFSDAGTVYESLALTADSQDPVRIYGLRGWARCLFRSGDLDRGREKYEAALADSQSLGDLGVQIESDTLLRWSRDEFEVGDEARSGVLLQRAVGAATTVRLRDVRGRLQSDAGALAASFALNSAPETESP